MLFNHVGRSEPSARAAIDLRGFIPSSAVLASLLCASTKLLPSKAVRDRISTASSVGCTRASASNVGLSVRKVHRPGEKLFLDYSGKKRRICDPSTGEFTVVELFAGVLGASNYTFVEAGSTTELRSSPRRPPSPKGKAKVEAGVLIAQRWILAHRVFFSLAALNNAIVELVEELNTRRFRKLPDGRRSSRSIGHA